MGLAGHDPAIEMEQTMKTIIMTAAIVGVAIGGLSSAYAADQQKKCPAGSQWDAAAKKCVKK